MGFFLHEQGSNPSLPEQKAVLNAVELRNGVRFLGQKRHTGALVDVAGFFFVLSVDAPREA